MFSAKPRDYRFATPTNVLYGSPRAGGHERQLFPGLIPLFLALVGLLLVRPTIPIIGYFIGLIVAFELSLGVYGRLSPFLYQHLDVFQGLRAPARASAFVLLFLGVLTASGIAALTSSFSMRTRHAIAALLCVGLLLEYRVHALALVPYYNEPPRLLLTWPPGPGESFSIAVAHQRVNGQPRSEVRLHVDVSLDAAGERIQRLLSAVVYRPARAPGAISGLFIASLRRDNVST